MAPTIVSSHNLRCGRTSSRSRHLLWPIFNFRPRLLPYRPEIYTGRQEDEGEFTTVHAHGSAQLDSSGYEHRRTLLYEVNTYTCESLLAKIEDQSGWTTTDSDSPSRAEHGLDTLETKYATILLVGCVLQEDTRHQAT